MVTADSRLERSGNTSTSDVFALIAMHSKIVTTPCLFYVVELGPVSAKLWVP